MKTLYLECNSGISGDMTVAALLDLGADEAVLRKGLASLHVDGFEIVVSRVKKCGVDACDFAVNLLPRKHGHEFYPEREYEHLIDAARAGLQNNMHFGIIEINRVIEESEITEGAKSLAKQIFLVLAQAESRVHALPVEQVHFHEIGAVDSIVDIVGTAICLDNLGITRVLCTPLNEGRGTVLCEHGLMPIPAPATLQIAQTHKIPLVIVENQAEMVTPTGAAIVAAITNSFEAPGAVTVLKTGCGAGKKDFAMANILRASILSQGSEGAGASGAVLQMECNLDDITGEQLAFACDILLNAGALDVWCTPVIMKKGRPAQVLSLLIAVQDKQEILRKLFLHTSTIGVRMWPCQRTVMDRKAGQLQTRHGILDIKECSYEEICKTTVEYESAKQAAMRCDVPIGEVYREAENVLSQQK